ncbi:helix-turn-helix transcriptional regulator [Ruegeria sp. SCP11]|uniref:helix-turn-helix transcriptional regulator n=1 Tax=Ruegeria sp. SCP11 TaxID=3141378 RepID=UPI0033378A88
MPRTIPLIRAANVLPLVGWLEKNRFPTSELLKSADLDYWFALSPFDPVPTQNVVQLIGDMAKTHGSDVGSRIVSEASLIELGFIGAVALGARTPAEALERVQIALPMHSSHETVKTEMDTSSLWVEECLTFKVEPAALHAIHVLFSSLIQQLCRLTGMQQPLLRKIEMCSHPERGTDYLENTFGCPVVPSNSQIVRIEIDRNVAFRSFRNIARDRSVQLLKRNIPPLSEDPSLAASVRSVISSMLFGGEPSINRVAGSAGMSVRSLQRRLSEEGTSFSTELDKVRTRLALEHLGVQDISLSDLSERLGYSDQSALSRAIRRLAGKAPTKLTKPASD